MALLRAPVVRSEDRGDRVDTDGSDPIERDSCQKRPTINAKETYKEKREKK
jgi:hypothetical protein